jgi:hypothetical protein
MRARPSEAPETLDEENPGFQKPRFAPDASVIPRS